MSEPGTPGERIAVWYARAIQHAADRVSNHPEADPQWVSVPLWAFPEELPGHAKSLADALRRSFHVLLAMTDADIAPRAPQIPQESGFSWVVCIIPDWQALRMDASGGFQALRGFCCGWSERDLILGPQIGGPSEGDDLDLRVQAGDQGERVHGVVAQLQDRLNQTTQQEQDPDGVPTERE